MYRTDGRGCPPRDDYADLIDAATPIRPARLTGDTLLIAVVVTTLFMAIFLSSIRDAIGLAGHDARA